jgi:sugar diacid utilization regulator
VHPSRPRRKVPQTRATAAVGRAPDFRTSVPAAALLKLGAEHGPGRDEGHALGLALQTVLELTGAVNGLVALVSPARPPTMRATSGMGPGKPAVLRRVARQALGKGEATFECGGLSLLATAAEAGEGEVALVAAAVQPEAWDSFAWRALPVALALAHSALLGRDRRRAAQVARLNATAQHVVASLDLDEVLTQIVRDAVELLSADNGDMLLLDEEQDVLRVAAVAAFPPEMLGFEMGRDEGVSAQAMSARRTTQVTDYQRYRRRVRRLDRYNFRAVLCAPLIARDKPIGALNVHATDPGRKFTWEDARLLTAFANHAAIAIDNARRYQDEVRLRRGLAEANSELTRSLTIQQRLAEQVLLDRGPPAVALELASVLGRPIVIQDHLLRVISGAAPDGGEEWRRLVLAPELLNTPVIAEFLGTLAAGGRAALAPVPPLEEPVRWVVPIRAGANDLSAYLLLPSAGPLAPLDQALLEIAATGVALELAKMRARVEVEHRLRGDLVQDLLTGAHTSSEAVAARAAHVGYDLAAPRDLILLQIDPSHGPEPGDTEAALIQLRRRFFDVIHAELTSRAPASMVATQSEMVVALVAQGPARQGGLGEAAPRLVVERLKAQLAAQLPGISASAVVGERCSNPNNYPASYQRALRTLQAVRKLGRRDVLVETGELGVSGLLISASSPEELRRFAEDFLKPLLDDPAHGGELLSTLRAYVESGFNQREAARRSFLHINTVVYRLRRIETLLGVDLRAPDALLDVMVALRVAALAELV